MEIFFILSWGAGPGKAGREKNQEKTIVEVIFFL